MNIDNPSQKHIPVLKALWREAFGDSEEFINSFFDTAYRSDKCFAVTEGDNVISALYILDCSFEGRKLAYIYAVATSKAYRGRGICKRLMQYTHESLEIFFLIFMRDSAILPEDIKEKQNAYLQEKS